MHCGRYEVIGGPLQAHHQHKGLTAFEITNSTKVYVGGSQVVVSLLYWAPIPSEPQVIDPSQLNYLIVSGDYVESIHFWLPSSNWQTFQRLEILPMVDQIAYFQDLFRNVEAQHASELETPPRPHLIWYITGQILVTALWPDNEPLWTGEEYPAQPTWLKALLESCLIWCVNSRQRLNVLVRSGESNDSEI